MTQIHRCLENSKAKCLKARPNNRIQRRPRSKVRINLSLPLAAPLMRSVRPLYADCIDRNIIRSHLHSMFENLKISNIKALRECQLQNLGKINVICGKNNSGKSTLLQGIHSTNNRKIGKLLDEASLNLFDEFCVEVTKRYRTTGPESLEQILTRVLRETAQAQDLWFADQKDAFANQIAKGVDIRELSDYVSTAWNQFYADNDNTILLPPKRHLELSQAFASSQQVLPTGEGILNHLFYIKNQDRASETYARYERLSKAFTEISSGYTFDIFLEYAQ